MRLFFFILRQNLLANWSKCYYYLAIGGENRLFWYGLVNGVKPLISNSLKWLSSIIECKNTGMRKIPKVILLIETSRAHGRGLLRGIAKYSRIHGPWAFYAESGHGETALPRLEKWGASGIITRIPDVKKTEQFIIKGLPAILVPLEEKIPGFPNIIDDCVTAGRMAAEHLLDRGFRKFAYFGFSDMHWS